MLAVNLGTRGLQEACALLEYANHQGGTYLSDRRIANGAEHPFKIKMWCLGNELDGPWQVGHKTAYEYGRLANETGKAMRLIDSEIELVACGSSNSSMPTFGSWESTVLEQCYETVDYVSLHAYYEELEGDPLSFLASAVDMDHFIQAVIATADAVGARLTESGSTSASMNGTSGTTAASVATVPNPGTHLGCSIHASSRMTTRSPTPSSSGPSSIRCSGMATGSPSPARPS